MDDKEKQTLNSINRRQFLKYSGAGTAVGMTGLLAPGLSLGSPTSPNQQVANIWLGDISTNPYETYYKKYKELLGSIDGGFNSSWTQLNKPIVLTLDLFKGQPHPHSTDPLLVYSTIKYLIEEKGISEKDVALSSRSPIKKSAALKLINQSGIKAAIRKALPSTKQRSLIQLSKMPLQWVESTMEDQISVLLASNRPLHSIQTDSRDPITHHLALVSCTRGLKDNRVFHALPGSIIASSEYNSCQLLSQLIEERFTSSGSKFSNIHNLYWKSHQMDEPLGKTESVKAYGKQFGINVVNSILV